MKGGWKIKKLGEVCEVVNGGTPKTGIPEYWDGRNLWITPAEMGRRLSPYVNDTERKITELGLRNSSARMLPPYSVILSSRAPIGHLVINTEPMATNQGCKGLIPSSQLQHKFLYYYLSSNVDLLNSLGTGATFRELSGNKLKDVTIPVPPLSEQKHIELILDAALSSIAVAKEKAERNLRNSRSLSENALENIFTRQNKNWVKKPLYELCDIKHGFAFRSDFFTGHGDYVLLTPGNFYESGGYRDRGEKQKYYCGEIPEGFILEKGDLLVAMTEQAAGLLGSPIIVPESNKYLHNQRLGLVIKKQGVPWINEFFFYVFNTKKVRQELHDSASGVKVRHTSPKKIGDVEVSFPPTIPEQRSIVSTLEELQKITKHLETIYQRKLAYLDELKKSVLHKAFNGELSGAN
jgi:type I restriction enzyme S subunit